MGNQPPAADSAAAGRVALASGGPVWERLQDQLDWYEGKSQHHRRWYQSLKVAQIVVAAAIPAVAAAGASAANCEVVNKRSARQCLPVHPP